MIKTITAAALSAIVALTSVGPAGAMPIPFKAASGYTAAEKVQYYDRRRHWDRRGYYNGHRGYRHHRPGYRRHSDGWWYPLAAFGLGAAIIGGMAAQQAPRPPVGVAMPVSHVRWCQGRYRSYDAYTNTFQPYNGPRRICVSPYYR